MNTITVNYDNKPCYNVNISDSFEDFAVSYDFSESKICIITDDNVANCVLDDFKAALNKEALCYCIAPGESSKTLDTVKGIYDFLIKNDFNRNDILIALGGGVIGDITGFAASTYERGISFVQVPTSLLAMVDSSIGGKTGVDFDGYKNMVGSFYMPKMVYINTSVLKSLPDREYFNGFAEVMKAALIRDSIFYTWLIDQMYEICEKDNEAVAHMIEKSVLIKKRVVEKDPTEKGERRILNFGHTIGHAIEKYSNFDLKHGECVALGSVASAFISWKKNWLTMEEYYEIRDMFVPFNLPISVELLDIDKVLENIKKDKKAENGTINFVLLKKIGKAVIDNTVTPEDIKEALNELNFDEAW